MPNFILTKLKHYSINNGNRVAIRYKDESITYSELMARTDIIAKKIKLKIKNRINQPIIIYQSRGIEFIEYIIAVLKCNCFYIPMDNNLPIERLKKIYNNINAELIISDNLTRMEGYDIFSPKLEVKEDDYNVKEQYSLIDVVKEKDLVYVIYTSGTTGIPKGVKIQYMNLKNLVLSLGEILYNKLSSPINIGVISSFSFDASVKQIYCSLYYGNTLIISDDSTRNFGRKLHKFHNINNLTVCDVTPSHLKLMVLQKTKYYSKIPYLFIGGENLSWSILQQYKNTFGYVPKIINVYGPTECCVDVTYNIIDKIHGNEKGNVPIGLPLKNTIIKIVDSNGNTITKKNIPGELYVSGKQVGAGYVDCESSSFIKDEDNNISMFKTGDLAFYDNEYNVVIISRIDRQIKIHGYRVELDEISSIIESYLKCQCIVCYIDNCKIPQLVAFLCNTKHYCSCKLQQYLKERLPKYMIPNRYIDVKEIPLTHNGKIDEKKLQSIYEGILI